MAYSGRSRILLSVTLCASAIGYAQGGRGRGAAAAQGQPTTAPAAGRGVPAAAPTGGMDFFNFDPSAGSALAIADGPPVESHQKIAVGGESLTYTARAGFLPLRNATSGQTEARIFYTSYSKDGAPDAASRPLVFFVGGAPGVSAAWQEFGGFGPKRMKWAGDGTAGMPPYAWTDNPQTLLTQADLVFANPVGTGYSRAELPSRAPSFWSTPTDTASLAEFVRSYLTAYNRRNSAIFVAAEDNGTARAAALAVYLQDHQIPVHGVILLSLTAAADATAGDTQFLTLFPSLVMAAWHHKKLAPELNAMTAEQISGQARQFASREYLRALYKGDRMTADERTKAIANYSRLTGLSKAFVASNNLRVTLDRFNSELMKEQHLGMSPSDSRVAGFVPPGVSGGRGGGGGGRGGFAAPAPIDFNMNNLSGGLQAAYEAYLRRELNFTGGAGVFYLNRGGVLNFTSSGADDGSLSTVLARDPKLRVFAAVNFFDLSAPFYATEYTLAHLNISSAARANNLTVSHYEAGQLAYVDTKALAKLQADLSRFVNEASTSGHK
jgi:carboxypeptidase C (cathepsin A)